VAITYPLTTLSTWQALERGGRKDEAKDEGAMRDMQSQALLPILGPIKELLQAVASNGWGSLFSGIGPTLSATAISQAVYFWLYSKLRHAVASALLLGDGGRLADIGVLGSTVVASLAGCGNVLITTPAWVIAMQMIAKEKSPVKAEREMDLKQVARKIYSEGGLVGLWRGLVPSLVMVLNPTIQFVLYERLVARLLTLRGGGKGSKKTLGAGDVFLLTAVAKLGSTLVTYPLLLIKSRLQAASKSDTVTQYTGVTHALRMILREEGFQGLFKGLRMKIVQTILTAALLMTLKEKTFKSLKSLISLASKPLPKSKLLS
jgi:adenine nucleotide transporter 17